MKLALHKPCGSPQPLTCDLELLDFNLSELTCDLELLDFNLSELTCHMQLLDFNLSELTCDLELLDFNLSELTCHMQLLDFNMSEVTYNLELLDFNMSDVTFNLQLLDFNMSEVTCNLQLPGFNLSEVTFYLELLDFNLSELTCPLQTFDFDLLEETRHRSQHTTSVPGNPLELRDTMVVLYQGRHYRILSSETGFHDYFVARNGSFPLLVHQLNIFQGNSERLIGNLLSLLSIPSKKLESIIQCQLLLGWVTAERWSHCKQSACPAIGDDSEVTLTPLSREATLERSKPSGGKNAIAPANHRQDEQSQIIQPSSARMQLTL
ncbi:hypothetical protein J6590_070920 [Homalodisca vitripennis]|nr:hypothetical protein J6590_070920 [Homalodisca vitripennis]